MEERMLDDRKTLEKQNGGTVLRGLFRYVRSAESITTQKHKNNNKEQQSDKTTPLDHTNKMGQHQRLTLYTCVLCYIMVLISHCLYTTTAT